MITFDTATAAHLANTTATVARLLVWIVAKDRDTGDPFEVGYWSGIDHETFTINGAPLKGTGGLGRPKHQGLFAPASPFTGRSFWV